MVAYFDYLREMFLKVLGDIGTFFYKAFVSPWTDLGNNFNTYNSYLTAHSGEFGFVGWLFWVIMLLLLIGLFAGLIFLIVIFLRKYIRFVRKELDKEELSRQVERLNYELFQAIQEKDKILNLKVGYMGLRGPESAQLDKESQEVVEEVSSRFPKLIHVDNKYRGTNMDIPYRPNLSLEELCNAFRNFAASQLKLYYK